MYKVLIDGALMCDSRIEELALLNPVVTLEENKAGSFSFTIPPEHPSYNSIQRRKTIVDVYLDDEEEPVFSGICIEADETFNKQKKISCEGSLTFLNDSIQRPKRYKGYTVRGLLEAYIANHNAQVEEKKQFQVGIVTVVDPNDYISCYTNMENTMTCLKEDLVDDLGGIIRVRFVNGIRYIDYLAESPNTNSQVIKFGKNLLDFTSNIDSSDIATAVIPLGAKLEESTVEGLETRLTIESVNNGCDYVYSAEAVAEYGWIYKKVEFDDVTTASNLKTKGEQYLAETQFEHMVIEAKAIDLHLTDSKEERFKISDQIRVLSAPHGLDKYIRLTKQTLNLNNRENDTVTLGKDETLSLSAKTNQSDSNIKKAVASIVPSSNILADAKANATQLIENAMGGYVYKTNDELYIMNTNDPETATKVWRWNINGLGYSKNGIKGPYELAMTIDGAIVADFIKAGTLTGIKLNNGNGTFLVDENGDVTANNANVNGSFESKGTYDSVKIINGNMNVFMSEIEVMKILGESYGGKKSAGIYFTSENFKVGEGMTKIGGFSATIPELTVGTSASENDTRFGCNGNANIFGDLYCSGTMSNASGNVTTSDRDNKNSIETLNQEEAVEFIYSLRPCKFKYNDGTSGRFHHGFIAQEVKESMGANDWGVYIKGKERSGLRYEEIMADLVAAVQSQNERIKELEKRGDE
jgi:phage minor structural protein